MQTLPSWGAWAPPPHKQAGIVVSRGSGNPQIKFLYFTVAPQNFSSTHSGLLARPSSTTRCSFGCNRDAAPREPGARRASPCCPRSAPQTQWGQLRALWEAHDAGTGLLRFFSETNKLIVIAVSQWVEGQEELLFFHSWGWQMVKEILWTGTSGWSGFLTSSRILISI